MIRNTANVSFYCRESKKNKDGLAPIELSLIINGKRCYVQLPRKEDPAVFKRDVNSKKDNDLKDYLRSIRVRLNEIETAFLRDGQALTAEALKKYYKTGGYIIYTVGDLFDDYMRILEKRIGIDLIEIPPHSDPFVPILYCPLVPIESAPHVLMMEYIIECSLERFLISTACIFLLDEKGKVRGSIRMRMRGSF